MGKYIEVEHIHKEFKILKSKPGLAGAFSSLFHREYDIKEAVEDISFSIERGEIVGYIGPNGAGKSTTIKMLSGVLTPDRGSVCVGGIVPYEKRKENARHIGVVFGQRSQLYWDLPIADTFELYQKLYEIDKESYRRNRDTFVELLDMGSFINQPVRQLSLGQKMKANLALTMLHNPEVLYLDEPTIGLDVMTKKALRESILLLNKEQNTTIMLTTHDMDDIEAVCSRLILIDKGRKLFDGKLDVFKEKYEDGITVTLEFADAPVWAGDERFSLQNAEDHRWTVKVRKGVTSKDALVALIEQYNPENLHIKEQEIEDIIQRIFV